jgi:hypothetical protein
MAIIPGIKADYLHPCFERINRPATDERRDRQMKYRRLKLDEKPDRRKGDQFYMQGREWRETNFDGMLTVKRLIGDDPTAKYRRPVDGQGRDLK